MSKTIKHKKIKGKITTLKALLYKDCMAYIRMINGEMFEWLLVFNGKIYSSYSIIRPRKGETKLNEKEISQVTALMWAGAVATIDTLLNEGLDKATDKLSKEKKKVVDAFQAGRKVIEE